MNSTIVKDMQSEAVKTVPALGGVAIYGYTLNEMVAIATLAYIVLQAAYLIWRWVKEARAK